MSVAAKVYALGVPPDDTARRDWARFDWFEVRSPFQQALPKAVAQDHRLAVQVSARLTGTPHDLSEADS